MNPENRLIFDIGMHNGDDTAFYLHRGYRVVAVEADPELAAAGRIRFEREITADRLTLLNVGIAPEEGGATFWLCEGRSEWNSFDRVAATRQGRSCRGIEIPCRRFHSILAEYGVPHYVKIDIETHDRHCLADLQPSQLPQYISIELTALAELATLQSLGYDAFKLVWQGRHAAVQDETRTFTTWALRYARPIAPLAWLMRKGSSLGRKLSRVWEKLGRLRSGEDARRGWIFPFGSSGPFGEEAPGAWVGFEEAAYRWLAIERIYPGEVWCDVHATRLAGGASLAASSSMREAA